MKALIQVDPSVDYKLLSNSQIENLHFSIGSLYCVGTFVLMSTKASNQPDGSPCKGVSELLPPPGAILFRRLRQAETARHHETDVDAERDRRPAERARGERGAAAGNPRPREDGGLLHAGGRQQCHREHLP